MKNCIKNLKKLIPNGYTQKDFAKEIGVSENSICNWCKGKPVSLKSYCKIFEYFSKNKKLSKTPVYVSGNKKLDIILLELTKQIDNVKNENRKNESELKKENNRIQEENRKLKEEIKKIKKENNSLKRTRPTREQEKLLQEREDEISDMEEDLEEREYELKREKKIYKQQVEVDIVKVMMRTKDIEKILREVVGKYFTSYASRIDYGKHYDEIYRCRKEVIFNEYTEMFIDCVVEDLGDYLFKRLKKINRP